jgi:hypothetical protein
LVAIVATRRIRTAGLKGPQPQGWIKPDGGRFAGSGNIGTPLRAPPFLLAGRAWPVCSMANLLQAFSGEALRQRHAGLPTGHRAAAEFSVIDRTNQPGSY